MSDNSYRPDQKKVEGLYESDKTIFWQAYQEARTLNNPALLPDLYRFIQDEKSEDEKGKAYFIIGQIGKNIQCVEATSFLMQRLRMEKSTSCITLLLHLLADLYKPKSFDLSIIYQLIEKRGAGIRSASYLALTNSECKVEDYLLQQLEMAKTKEDTETIIYALGYVGTEKSIEKLKPLIKSRKFAIKHAVQNNLPTIMIRAGYSITAVCKATKVSTDFVNHRKKMISLLSRPG